MKFLYEYRTSDNAPHKGVVCASDRDAAFAQLKSQGVRPSRLVEAPGLFNRVFGKGKRWLAIAALAIATAAFALYFFRVRGDISVGEAFENTTRRQVIGDAAKVQKGILDGWSEVFPDEGERFLAGFAVPGVPVSVRNTTEKEIRDALARRVPVLATDSLEARQIKSMVEGMKQELRDFLRDGGSVVGYGQRLVQRQELEIAHYNRAKSEIDRLVADNADPDLLRARWEHLNDNLRKMGIRLVAWPE